MSVVFSEKDMKPELAPDPEYFDDIREDREDIRRSVESGYSEAKSSVEHGRDVEDSRDYREKLESLFPGRRDYEAGKIFADLEDAVERDPLNGGHAVTQWTVNNLGRFGTPTADAPKTHAYGLVERKLPSGETTLRAPGTIGDEIAQAMTRVPKERAGSAELQALQKRLAAKGRTLEEHYRLAHDFAVEAGKNPMHAAAKLAGLKGLALDGETAAAREAVSQADAWRNQEGERLLANEYADVGRENLQRYIAMGWMKAQPDPRQTLEIARQHRAIEGQIERFKNTHPDYPKVKDRMAALIREGKAKGLDDAYAQITAKPRKRGADDPTIRDDIRRAARGRL